jgi:hypothetical protein
MGINLAQTVGTALQRPLPNNALRIVATGEKSDLAPVKE